MLLHGTGSVRVIAQGLSCSYNKLSPSKIPSTRLKLPLGLRGWNLDDQEKSKAPLSQLVNAEVNSGKV